MDCIHSLDSELALLYVRLVGGRPRSRREVRGAPRSRAPRSGAPRSRAPRSRAPRSGAPGGGAPGGAVVGGAAPGDHELLVGLQPLVRIARRAAVAHHGLRV